MLQTLTVQPLPARAGIGLRAPHCAQLIETQPTIAWVEVHSENYFCLGGPPLIALQRIADLYPLSLHGVGLSLGSTDAFDTQHLAHLKRLVTQFQPALVSEHLSWSSVNGQFVNDLLPLPYTQEALQHLTARITIIQDFLGRQILIENISSYLQFECSHLAESEFIAALVADSGCGLLLDINNLYVASVNHGIDAKEYIAALPVDSVQEIHLAGHRSLTIDGMPMLIDSHDAQVCDAVWDLYAVASRRFGPKPTLIEWDADLPALQVLLDEARRADRVQGQCHAVAA